MSTTTQELSADWWFKQADESSDEEWLPVSKVPTVVHVDLQENGKYDSGAVFIRLTKLETYVYT